jgi:hypothetical protein
MAVVLRRLSQVGDRLRAVHVPHADVGDDEIEGHVLADLGPDPGCRDASA